MSKPVKVFATKRFEKDLQKLPSSVRKRFAEILTTLSSSPYGFEVLSGQFRGLRRIRIGDYRAIYKIDEEQTETVVRLLFIAHRKKVYE